MNSLEDQLMEGLVKSYAARGKNIQAILDNPLFKDLPLDQKVKFIKNYSTQLKQDPKYNWSAIGIGTIGGALSATGAVRVGQLAAGKSNPSALLWAAGLGAVTGGIIDSFWSNREYNNNVRTKNNIDDAIKTLVDRSTQHGVARPNYIGRALDNFGKMPETAAVTIAENIHKY